MDSRGKETKGTLEVGNQSEAIARLKEMGFFPTRVVEVEKAKEKDKSAPAAAKAAAKKGGPSKGINLNIKIPGLSGRVKTKVLTNFTRQLATLVDAGLPLLRGLRVLEKQERNVTLKEIIGKLGLAIEGGSTFSEGLAQHPKIFNKLFVNMVKAGELGGVLEVVLARLAEFMEKAQKIKGKVVAAMFYPCAVMFVAVCILTVLMVWVVPRFQDIFKDMIPGEAMPPFTVLVLSISNAIAHHFVVTFCCVVLVVVSLVLFIKTTTGRKLWDRFRLHMPVLGPVISKVAISRFSRTLGTLIS
ncbi:MAG: type II secretion system F family protein, partial [Verrucomicrobia bacterium]|nr:type II secretion system F family protein [Verrucomicrobiota bacterium]